MISAVGLRYPAPRGRTAGRHPRPRRRAARRALLSDALRGGRFVLLGRRAADLPGPVDAAEPRGGGERDRLTLVRPDGYVGWAGAAHRFPAWAQEYFGHRAAALTAGGRHERDTA